MGTYENFAGTNGDALSLYSWNSQVSGALLTPLHVCEVVVRNAVADALASVYGERWPWSPSFEQSLPNPAVGYSPRKDLFNARRSAPTTGKVIPELKFVFWQKMFTSRHDLRLWQPHMSAVFPHLDHSQATSVSRNTIYSNLEQVRGLRNRIAHHEPIFARNLSEDYRKVSELIGYRCLLTAAWIDAGQQASALIATGP
ncbi:hypothetical protein JH314_16705 [Xanthomonas campestris]|nr:hypothetical protein JH314_16705 [Xanthomonas campestris]